MVRFLRNDCLVQLNLLGAANKVAEEAALRSVFEVVALKMLILINNIPYLRFNLINNC